jgi:hypothetical protein
MSARSSTRTEPRALLVALAAVLLGAVGCKDPGNSEEGGPAAEPLKVAAASDLAKAFAEVGEA